jgi:purine-binding chemotaxis protein CheW
MSPPIQFCTFFLGDELFGLDVMKVQEIVRPHPMTPVPLAHPAIRGLINLRGQIVTTIDLRRRLGMADCLDIGDQFNVVVDTDDGAVSLLVDVIGDVVSVTHDQFEQSPDTLAGPTRELVTGVYKLQDRLLLALDLEKVVDATT